MASILITYGMGLAVLAWGAQELAPKLGRITLLTGLVGGGLGLLWGVAAVAGLKGRAWAALSVIATAFVLLSQAIHVWSVSASEGDGSVALRVLVVVMLGLSMGMLMYLLHGERPPEFYQRGNLRHDIAAAGQLENRSRDARTAR